MVDKEAIIAFIKGLYQLVFVCARYWYQKFYKVEAFLSVYQCSSSDGVLEIKTGSGRI